MSEKPRGTCGKCGNPTILFEDGTLAHSNIIDFFICAEVKAIPGGPAKIPYEDFATKMADRSRRALETKDWGTT